MKFKYIAIQFVCFVLSMAMAVSIVVVVFSGMFVGFFQSEKYINNYLEKYQIETIDTINQAVVEVSEKSDVPAEILTDVLKTDDVKIILKEAAHNFAYGYATDFSDNSDLYNCFKSGLINYNAQNDDSLTEAELNSYACLGVDIVNETFGGKYTASVKLFSLSQSSKMIYIIAVPVVLIIAAFVILDLINYGRHRKFSYIGMGIATAGWILTFVPLFISYKKYIDSYNYCGIDVFNKAIADSVYLPFKIALIIGVLLLIAGTVILLMNYRYFKKKNDQVTSVRAHNSKLRDEYMAEYNEHNKDKLNRHVNPEEKTFTKIDFDK